MEGVKNELDLYCSWPEIHALLGTDEHSSFHCLLYECNYTPGVDFDEVSDSFWPCRPAPILVRAQDALSVKLNSGLWVFLIQVTLVS